VTIAARNLDAAHTAAQEISAATGNPDVRAAQVDLADLASVGELVKNWTGPLHILVNNAGIMATPERRTPGGRELQFATNHLGHFALAVGLHDSLTSAGGARVVVVSSVGHVNGRSASRTSTSPARRTTHGSRTRSPRRRTSCLRSRQPGDGPPTGSP
jgi:NAD(P)-dependent dehydrogenase (short-subunit alcohol dehydrogenase family)